MDFGFESLGSLVKLFNLSIVLGNGYVNRTSGIAGAGKQGLEELDGLGEGGLL